MEENLNSQIPDSNQYSKGTFVPEIDSIQQELSELVENINNFIINETKNEVTEAVKYEYTNDGNTEEKEDNISEKYKGDEPTNDTAIEPCTSNAETEIAEVDWSVAGPVLQKHVLDLERLHSLNVATSALIRRVKELALNKSIHLQTNIEENPT